MEIDYEGLYAHNYMGHRPGATSFHGRFPAQLSAIARDLRCAGVLDVGAGNGALIAQLASFGLEVAGLDLRPDPERGVLRFDLTSSDFCQGQALAARLRPALGSPHLTTCLDVLEHIDRKHMAGALANLRELAGEWLLVSVSTRPSSRYNLYHATVAPRRTWRALFEAAGFRVEEHPALASLPFFQEYGTGEGMECLIRWRRSNPFRDTSGPEPCYLLLRRTRVPVGLERLRATCEAVLGIVPGTSRPRPALGPAAHLLFLVGHYQDFLHYIPFWDALDPARSTTLVRTGHLREIEAHRLCAVQAYLRARGIAHQCVESLREVDWSVGAGARKALIAASESTANRGHLLNAAFVLAARARQYRTFQLQHGIWPHADFQESIVFQAEHALVWSHEFRDGFLQPLAASGPARPRGLVGQMRFTTTGCPKFDAYADSRAVALADVLGDWVRGYDHSLLVATNLHWHQHRSGHQVWPALREAAEQRPTTLFVVKLHPTHDLADQLSETLPANLLVLDELTCLCGHLTTPRLLRACDAVIGTLTTVVLEAALAGKPFCVLDTGNPNRYAGVAPVALARLDGEIDRLLTAPFQDHDEFLDHYYDRSNLGLSLPRVLATIEEDLSGTPAPWDDPSLVIAEAYASTLVDHYVPDGRIERERRTSALEERAESSHEPATAESRTRTEDEPGELERSRASLAAAQARISGLEAQISLLENQLATVLNPLPSAPKSAFGLRSLSLRQSRSALALRTVAHAGTRLFRRVTRGWPENR